METPKSAPHLPPTRPKMSAAEVAERAGVSDSNQGYSAGANPYAEGTPESAAWALGFHRRSVPSVEAMTAPSRATAVAELRIKLAEVLPNVETIGTIVVRCRSWDGRQNSAAFCVVVLSDYGAPAANGAIFVTHGGRWTVVLHVDEAKTEEPLASFLRRTEEHYHAHAPRKLVTS